ncbi:hypothetical protein BG006_011249 [Podila minutissima]|uniref:Uncharacterized protein n=1 Tax=Podila minutissima TaxID=64525 RepID=A0A9P5SC91_9FUNG|nr:hypothetical protein BG006_011249 [Podila minutissima]
MSANDWRRQKVEDHKFDFIDVEDYVDNTVWRKFKYSLVFAIVIKGILVYCADLWTAVNLLVSQKWTNNLGVDGQDKISLAWDIKKAVAIIQSRDISYAFTSMIAYRYYAIKSYAHFCLFERIHNSKKHIDEIAFFCFFTFRGWKRLIFADSPRQVINGIILTTVFLENKKKSMHLDLSFWTWVDSPLARITMGLMVFTLTLWVISVLYMIAAVFLYIPLVIHIQGNLKEYCCHKIDKRIDGIVKEKVRERAKDAKNSKGGKGGDTPLQQPTLPNIGLIAGGARNSPGPGATPRMGNQTPYMGSPVMRKGVPPQDPYRRPAHPQAPPRPYSPGPRAYNPSMDDDGDTRPLRQGNYQQHYHNRNLRQQNQQYDYADDQSEISDAYSGGGGYMHHQQPPKPIHPGHRRQPSDTSTVLSGSNQGSVVGGYGPRTGKPHPLQHGHTMPNNGRYAETMMMTDMGPPRSGSPSPYAGPGQGHHGPPTGLGGGVGHNPGGSVVGGGSVVNGPGYVDQQRGRYQQAPNPHYNRPYN